MLVPLAKGRHLARLAQGPDDLKAAQRLRGRAFAARPGTADPDGMALDADDMDAACLHVLIEERAGGRLVGCYRALPLAGGVGIAGSYAARSYDLTRLAAYPAPMIEMGRFCTAPDRRDPDIPRLAWAAMARLVAATDARLLFGCPSFAGTDPRPHAPALARLRDRHLGPDRWRPGIKARDVVRFDRLPAPAPADPRAGLAAMPPLLRSYLAMGGWVGDHAVIDPALRTLHVFTAVEIRAIPEARLRRLRGLAA